jgi:hypothetical protein
MKPRNKRGITVADVLRVFRGARVISRPPKRPLPQTRQLELIQGGKR